MSVYFRICIESGKFPTFLASCGEHIVGSVCVIYSVIMSSSDDFKRKRPPRSELRKLRRSFSTGSASMSVTQTMTVTAEADSGNSSGMNSEPETKHSETSTIVLPDKP